MSSALVEGLLTGLGYGLLGLGLVLVYRTARFVNLAHAQLGVLGALLLAKLTLDAGWGYWAALPIALGSGVLVGVLAEVVLIRRLRAHNNLSLLLLSLGLAQVLLALTYVELLLPDRGRLARSGYPVPFDVHWQVGGFVLRGQHVLILVLAPALAAGLAAFLAWSEPGRAMRAVASNRDEARLCGIRPGRVQATAWGLAGGLSAITAILQAPSQGSFNLPALGPDLLLRALGAAAIGGFTSLPGAAAGGVALGLLEHVALHLSGNGGVAELVVLATVVVALLARSRAVRGIVDSGDGEPRETPATVPTPRLARRTLVRHERGWVMAAGLFVAVLAPLWPVFRPESKRFLLAVLIVFALLSVSLTVVLGWSGQVSLGHFALLGVGAYLTARLGPHGWSMPLLIAAAGAIGAVVMVGVGAPTARLPGVALTVTSLGFALVAPSWLYVQRWVAPAGSTTTRAPTLAGLGRPDSELAVYYSALAVLAVATVCLGALRRSTAGRLVLATRDNERGVRTLGFAPARVKLSMLAVSGFVAAAAGVLWISAWRTVSPDLLAPESSFVILAAPVIGGLGSLAGAVLGTVYVFGPSFFFGAWTRSVFGNSIGMTLLISGAGIVAVQLWLPGGLASAVRRGWDRYLARLDRSLAEVEAGG